MPLQAGSSQAAFEHNLKTELAAGKPKDQALAISYAKQRGDMAICDDLGKAIRLVEGVNSTEEDEALLIARNIADCVSK